MYIKKKTKIQCTLKQNTPPPKKKEKDDLVKYSNHINMYNMTSLHTCGECTVDNTSKIYTGYTVIFALLILHHSNSPLELKKSIDYGKIKKNDKIL